jgi:hypothetical protein
MLPVPAISTPRSSALFEVFEIRVVVAFINVEVGGRIVSTFSFAA